MSKMFKIFLAGIFFVTSVKACSDFVFVIDGEADDNLLGRGLQRRRDLAIKTAQQLELGTGLHKAALVFYGRRSLDSLIVSSFDDSQIKDSFTSNIRAQFDNLLFQNSSSKALPNSVGTADAVDIVIKQLLPHKRMGVPVVILFFTDGEMRPNELPKLEKISSKLAKKHYVHTFAINAESSISTERFATLLLLTNNEKKSIITAQDRTASPEQRLTSTLRPFISCEQTSKFRTLRRKPVALAPASVAPKIPVATTRLPIRGSRFTARPSTTRPLTIRPGCLMDIVFLMDFSGGAIDKREKYINIASEMIRNMQLGDFATQIAFVRYSGLRRTDSVFHLRKHQNNTAAINEISGTPSLGGTTRTGAAMLDAAREFDPRYGGRVDAQKFMVVFTDAYSQDDPVDSSAKLYKERVKVLAVAVDDSSQPPDHEQLKAIATDPKSIFLEKDFPKLFTYFSQPQCRQ